MSDRMDDREGKRWTAPGDEMRRRRSLTRQVDTTLPRAEQETTLSFFGDGDRFRAITYKPTMVRALLRHDYARIAWVYVMEDGERGRRVSNLSGISRGEEDVRIEGVSVSLPLGALSLKGSPRGRDAHSEIIVTPDDARTVAATFADSGGGSE